MKHFSLTKFHHSAFLVAIALKNFLQSANALFVFSNMGKISQPTDGATGKPLDGFMPLNPMISLYTPPHRPTTPESLEAPNLIILAPWMDSEPRHIHKYISPYQKLFPSARILLIRSVLADLLYRPSPLQQWQLKPAADTIRACLSKTEKPKILLHLFSNGGAQQTCQLARLWKKEQGGSLPLTGMILDSAPERGEYWRVMPALLQGLPRNVLLRSVGTVLVHLATSWVWILQHVFRIDNVGEVIARDLNDPALMPKIPRCYLYSREDSIVDWQAVEHHAGDAKKLDWPVHTVKFEGTKHVAHVIGNEQKYWDTVIRLWQECSKLQAASASVGSNSHGMHLAQL